jgi:hypothetical protein
MPLRCLWLRTVQVLHEATLDLSKKGVPTICKILPMYTFAPGCGSTRTQTSGPTSDPYSFSIGASQTSGCCIASGKFLGTDGVEILKTAAVWARALGFLRAVAQSAPAAFAAASTAWDSRESWIAFDGTWVRVERRGGWAGAEAGGGAIICRCRGIGISLGCDSRNRNVRVISSSYFHISPCWRTRRMPDSLLENDVT